MVRSPLNTTETAGKYDILARCHGGGVSGQAGAMVLGIARALITSEPELRPTLKSAGMLSRDPRMKERKKYGRRGARRGFQFSKR
jgi:small subunit ribosomal protein S9